MDSIDRKPKAKTPWVNIQFEPEEKQMLERQSHQHKVSMTTYVRTLIVLCEKGILKAPADAFR